MDHHHHEHGPAHEATTGTTLEISLKNCHDATDLAGIERYLSTAPGVRGVHLDRTRALAHVTIDPQTTSAAALHDALSRAGYGCVCEHATAETPAEHQHAPDATGPRLSWRGENGPRRLRTSGGSHPRGSP